MCETHSAFAAKQPGQYLRGVGPTACALSRTHTKRETSQVMLVRSTSDEQLESRSCSAVMINAIIAEAEISELDATKRKKGEGVEWLPWHEDCCAYGLEDLPTEFQRRT